MQNYFNYSLKSAAHFEYAALFPDKADAERALLQYTSI
jgi:hypothetical protein